MERRPPADRPVVTACSLFANIVQMPEIFDGDQPDVQRSMSAGTEPRRASPWVSLAFAIMTPPRSRTLRVCRHCVPVISTRRKGPPHAAPARSRWRTRIFRTTLIRTRVRSGLSHVHRPARDAHHRCRFVARSASFTSGKFSRSVLRLPWCSSTVFLLPFLGLSGEGLLEPHGDGCPLTGGSSRACARRRCRRRSAPTLPAGEGPWAGSGASSTARRGSPSRPAP